MEGEFEYVAARGRLNGRRPAAFERPPKQAVRLNGELQPAAARKEEESLFAGACSTD
jgi:hypothetical protein